MRAEPSRWHPQTRERSRQWRRLETRAFGGRLGCAFQDGVERGQQLFVLVSAVVSDADEPPLINRLRTPSQASIVFELEDGDKGLLRDGHRTHLHHALLPLLLLLEELALAGDVAAIALGDDVLAKGVDGLS